MLYMIRHGQAGLRHNYDTLSELGREQARLLGRYLAERGICFDAVYAGGLERQRETAALLAEEYRAAGGALPEVRVEPGWSEFDLDGVMRGIVPLLGADDPEFAAASERQQQAVSSATSELHRRWTPCDTQALFAWICGRYTLPGVETWPQFCDRVAACRSALHGLGDALNIAVITSATPISLTVGSFFHLPAERVMYLAGVMFNTAITTFREFDGALGPVTFNALPHLTEARLVTHR